MQAQQTVEWSFQCTRARTLVAATPLATASYNAALVACVEGGEFAYALNLLSTMRSRGVVLNALSYTAAIAAAHHIGATHVAVSTLTLLNLILTSP